MHKRQLTVFGFMLFTYALATFVSVAFLFDPMSMGLPGFTN